MAFKINLNDTSEFVIKSCLLGHKIKLLTPNGWLISSKILKKFKKLGLDLVRVTWWRPNFFPKYYSFLNYLSVTAQTLKMQPSRQLFVKKMMDSFKFFIKGHIDLERSILWLLYQRLHLHHPCFNFAQNWQLEFFQCPLKII